MKRPTFMAASVAAAAAAFSSPAAVSAADPAGTTVDDLVYANRILANEGVVDGFGHISVRSPATPGRFLLARNVAPGLVTAADIMEFDFDGVPVDQRDRKIYLERFIHAAIYRARPDVQSVVHSHSPSIVPFSVTPVPLRPLYHMTGFLGEHVPNFEIRHTAGDATNLLISNIALGNALAETLGASPVALMRGHGMVIVGSSIKQAVFRAVYTETNAHLQSEALKLGAVTYLTGAEAAAAATTLDGQVDRPWDLWKRKVTL